jgi:hypothetical protein
VRSWSEGITALAGQVSLERSGDSSFLVLSITSHILLHGISTNNGKYGNICDLKHGRIYMPRPSMTTTNGVHDQNEKK